MFRSLKSMSLKSKKRISVSSLKAKGRELQNLVRDKIYEAFPKLQEGDVKGAIMGQTGEDIILSPAARKVFPYSVECKRKKTFAIYGMYEQAENNSGGREPLLVIRGDRKKPLAVVDLEHFMELAKNGK